MSLTYLLYTPTRLSNVLLKIAKKMYDLMWEPKLIKIQLNLIKGTCEDYKNRQILNENMCSALL